MGLRFFQVLTHQRPTVGASGDLVSGASSNVSGAVWHRRRKAVIGGQGELESIDAIGFIPSGVDIQTRDQLTISGTALRFEVVHVVSGYDDRGTIDHVGLELRCI
jgi:hypothetical protein